MMSLILKAAQPIIFNKNNQITLNIRLFKKDILKSETSVSICKVILTKCLNIYLLRM